MHTALISIKTELNRVNLDSVSKGTLRVLDGPIKMKAIPPWQAQGEEGYLKGSLERLQSRKTEQDEQMLINSVQVCMVHCLICGQQKNVAKLNMFRNGTWAPIYCRTCRLNRKSSKWKNVHVVSAGTNAKYTGNMDLIADPMRNRSTLRAKMIIAWDSKAASFRDL